MAPHRQSGTLGWAAFGPVAFCRAALRGPAAARAIAALASAAFVVLLVAPAGAKTRAKPHGTVVVKAGRVGRAIVLVAANGRTLYVLRGDRRGEGCAGACLSAWPVLGLRAGRVPRAGRGVRGRLAVIRRADGRRQVTFRGRPVYFLSGDSRPGQANGTSIPGWSTIKAR